MPFNDIIGQEKAIRVLRAYLGNSRFTGGYLFTGPDGVGKKALALRAAQALLCEKGNNDPCGVCSSCTRAAARQHPDVHVIEAGDGDIKIEEIRQLQRAMSLRSYEGGAKVFIIDNAHRLNAESANCLLKVLEEPPAGSVIILVTSKPSLLLKTVVSRCKLLKCPALERGCLEDMLVERYGVKRDEAHFFAYYAEGSLGAALRLKETMSLVEKNGIIDLFMKDAGEKTAAVTREELRFSLSVLASWVRDMMLMKIGIPDRELVNADRSHDLRGWGARFSSTRLYEIMKIIADSFLYIDQNINARLILSHVHSELSVR